MKIVTSAVIFNEALGMRLSYSYSEVDGTGAVTKDNLREDRVITDSKHKKILQQVLDIAQEYINIKEVKNND